MAESRDPITTEQMLDRALAHHRAGRLAEAGAIYREILQRDPRNVDAVYFLGVLAHQAAEHELAIERMELALKIMPDQERCYNILGLARMALGRSEEAEASLRRAVLISHRAAESLPPGESCSIVAHVNLCALLKAQNRLRDALPIYQAALELNPRDAELYTELGDTLQTLGQLDLALEAYGKALEMDPGLARAWYAAGCAENARREYVSACECFKKALEQNPDWPPALHNLGEAQYRLGQTDRAIDLFRQAARAPGSELSLLAIASVIPGSPAATNQSILEARRAFARTLPPRRALRQRAKNNRLRVGYLSAFFADRNWMKPVWGLIRNHDHEQFDLHLFSDGARSAIQFGDPGGEIFHDISGLSNEDAVALMERTGIDLLIDLNGYSAVRRLGLIALHPAPVVAAWFNMFASSGIDGYDYLIGDDTVIPPGEERFYSEKILRVEGSYLTFELNYPVPEVSAAPCRSNGFVTFGCLAPLYKINDGVIAVWNRILEQSPGSKLLLRNAQLGSAKNRSYLREKFRDPGRVLLEGPAEHLEYLKTYNRIDLALDTFPYSGGTTASEAIWQGVPVLTFEGDRWASRTSASILCAAGLRDFVASDLESYVAMAAGVSSQKLAELRAEMRPRLKASSICDTAGFARRMEQIYRQISA